MARVRFRRKDLRGPDEFVEFTGRAWAWAAENRRLLVSLAVGVVALVVAVGAVREYLDRRVDRAAADFGAALKLYTAGDSRGAMSAFAEVPAVGAYATLASLYRGHAALKVNDPPAAIEAYRAAAGNTSAPAYVRQEAHLGSGQALVAHGNEKEALDHFREAAGLDGPFRIDASLAAGRIAESLGDTAQARALYAEAAEQAEEGGPAQDEMKALAEWRAAALAPAAERTPTPAAADGN